VNATCEPRRVDDLGAAVRVVGLEVEYDPWTETVKPGELRSSGPPKAWKYVLNTVRSYGFELISEE
jgi:hypothetical protein